MLGAGHQPKEMATHLGSDVSPQPSHRTLPQGLTMEAEFQRSAAEGPGGHYLSVDYVCEATNIAEETSRIAPTEAAFGTVGVLLRRSRHISSSAVIRSKYTYPGLNG